MYLTSASKHKEEGMFKPRDIVRREGLLYVVEQIVEDDRGEHLYVKDFDGDSRWIFHSRVCEKVAGRPVHL